MTTMLFTIRNTGEIVVSRVEDRQRQPKRSLNHSIPIIELLNPYFSAFAYEEIRKNTQNQ